MKSQEQIKERTQIWILSISVLLLLGKFAAYCITDSVGIFTDAIESIVNVAAGFISLYSLRLAAKPEDKEHPFGHGKIELISASIEGLLITTAGGIVIYEAVSRFFTPSQIQQLDTGILVVAIAGLINYLMGWYSIRVGNRYKSMALIAGGRHLQSDTYSTIGLVLGLLLLQYTQLSWIDSALAILFGGFIIFAGLSILRKTVTNLLDGADEELLEQIAQSINDSRRNDWIDIHNTKVIKSGNQLYIDCDLTLPWFYNLEEGHESCERLKNTFETKLLHRVQVSIHTDPCGRNRCAHCRVEKCMSRIRLFESSENISILQLVQSDDERNS